MGLSSLTNIVFGDTAFRTAYTRSPVVVTTMTLTNGVFFRDFAFACMAIPRKHQYRDDSYYTFHVLLQFLTI